MASADTRIATIRVIVSANIQKSRAKSQKEGPEALEPAKRLAP